MEKQLITQLFSSFEAIKELKDGFEIWTARRLQKLLGYTDRRNFLQVTEKAKTSCKEAGNLISDHFVDVNKMVRLGSESERLVDDIELSRYACYLIAQNGDPRKYIAKQNILLSSVDGYTRTIHFLI